MSQWHAHGDPAGGAADWTSLSGDRRMGASSGTGAGEPAPIAGGWEQSWQDAHGQWHYPYGPLVAAPGAGTAMGAQSASPAPEADPAPAPTPRSLVVPLESLQPTQPRYLAPARVAQDPRQRTLAAVLTFLMLLLALWAILGFTGSLSSTLASISNGSARLETQVAQANEGLVQLDAKTGRLQQMADDSRRMRGLLRTVDSDMGGMLESVGTIATGMRAMDTSLATLDTELAQVNRINEGMTGTLAEIDRGLASQARSVGAMRRDVAATGGVLGSLPGRLRATNARLTHVNGAVNIMGCRGITNNLEVGIRVGPLSTGAAKVFATVVPPGAWGTREDGRTPC